MYVKPEVTQYSGAELLDLMGPVETGYACSLDGGPEPFILCETVEFTVGMRDIEECDSFKWVLTGPDNCDSSTREGECRPDSGGDYDWGTDNCPFTSSGEYAFEGNLCNILDCAMSDPYTLKIQLQCEGFESEVCDDTLNHIE
jgi:hypothetical protein